MTVIFNKQTGIIKMIFSGEDQHISTAFGNKSEDYMKKYDEVILTDDISVMQDVQNYKINLDDKSLENLNSESKALFTDNLNR